MQQDTSGARVVGSLVGLGPFSGRGVWLASVAVAILALALVAVDRDTSTVLGVLVVLVAILLFSAFSAVGAADAGRATTAAARAGDVRQPSGSLFQAVVEGAPDALVVTDPQGTIRLVNERTEALFGYRRGELIGQIVETLIPERFRGPHAGHRTGYAMHPHVGAMGTGLELSGRRRDGTEFPIEVSLSPLETAVGTLIAAAIRDVTERQRLEEDRRRIGALQVRNAEVASRLKSEFLATMSHELRTPLNAIIGFAELLHDGKTGPVTGRQKEFLKDILLSGEHLLHLINGVLDLSKIEAGRIELRPVPVQSVRLIGEVTDVLRTLAARKQIRLETAVDPAVGTVLTDPARLKQVLYNYLSNALKFTAPGGRIAVRLRPEGHAAFLLEVEDNGIGIRAEDMDRLFVEFQQLDASGQGPAGTGLGLALTKRLVEAQGGRVGATSVVGRGSTFFAVLPLVRPIVDLPHPVARAGSGPRRPTTDEIGPMELLAEARGAAGRERRDGG